jgi:hypothetical protein
MTLERLKSLMAGGTPVFYIQQEHVFVSSILSIQETRDSTYITLEDGVMLNVANFGVVAFWSEDEAKVALAGEVATGGRA